ncbi:prepilin-type N-terminal cleavage/methylation domain-containing protein [Aquincola sp. S2]|uniref:Type II secretion system protein H n=1 Tax=Pseudaquabacterium terrae TaxID=2732868 RepID=A0ABX2ENI2_9BURK|nr:GspH/FimT family pseudopilin [Aquabacterium terrae]NRF70206.1 prepilin-type N-terminal cleavage/methylation domain-containing protein [Aquabacterium terrae]
MKHRIGHTRGLTLIELMIAIAILAVLGTLAAAPMAAWAARQRVQAAAAHLVADVAEARHEAARRGQVLRVNFTQGSAWCYAITVDSAARCDNAGHPAVLKRVSTKDHPGVIITLAETFELDGRSGAALQAPASVQLTSSRGDVLQVRMGRLGRASVCSPDGLIKGVAHC